MKHAVLAAIAAAALVLCAPAQVQAQVQVIASTSQPANLRAGPSIDYPVVAVLPAGFQVAVQGCLADYTWCDVVAGYDRGWIYGGIISYPYQNQWAPLLTWGPVIGIGIVGFAFDDYWPRYYWNRPWFVDRDRWAHVPPHHLRPRPGLPAPPDGRRPFVRPPQGGHPPAPPHEGWRAPGRVTPGGPARPAQPPAPQPPRPPGWRPEPRVGPVPHQGPPAERRAPPAAGTGERRAPPGAGGGERRSPRGGSERHD